MSRFSAQSPVRSPYSPLSPRSLFAEYEGEGGYGSPTGTSASYKLPGTLISYVGGLTRSSDNVLENAPGAPPPVEDLGYYGNWKGTRFGYILAVSNSNSRRALQNRGFPVPSPMEVKQALKLYWNNLPDDEYARVKRQLQALADEQNYEPQLTLRSTEASRRTLSPLALENRGYVGTGSYARQYGREEEEVEEY